MTVVKDITAYVLNHNAFYNLDSITCYMYIDGADIPLSFRLYQNASGINLTSSHLNTFV